MYTPGPNGPELKTKNAKKTAVMQNIIRQQSPPQVKRQIFFADIPFEGGVGVVDITSG